MIRKRECYIYGLRPKDGTIYFYVGSTKRAVSVRLENHLCNARTERGSNKHLIRKIRAIGPENVVADVLEITNQQGRFNREYHWISDLKRQGVNLCNLLMVSSPPRTEWTIEELDQIFNSGPASDPIIELIRQAGLKGVALLKEARAEGMVVV